MQVNVALGFIVLPFPKPGLLGIPRSPRGRLIVRPNSIPCSSGRHVQRRSALTNPYRRSCSNCLRARTTRAAVVVATAGLIGCRVSSVNAYRQSARFHRVAARICEHKVRGLSTRPSMGRETNNIIVGSHGELKVFSRLPVQTPVSTRMVVIGEVSIWRLAGRADWPGGWVG